MYFFSLEWWARALALLSVDLNLLLTVMPVPPKHLPRAYFRSSCSPALQFLPPIPVAMNSDLLSSIAYLLSAVPTFPSHDQLNVTIYENGFAASSALTTPVLSESALSKAHFYPRLFVAIRSVLVHAAIRWPSMM